jgi:hypothetical protein
MSLKPEILKLDYEKTLAAIDKYDGHVQEIKKWSITACGAVLLLGIREKSLAITTLTIFIACGFWFVALICKTFLIAAWERARKLECVMQGKVPEEVASYQFGFVHAISPSTTSIKILTRTSFHWLGRHVTQFYLLVIVVTILADLYLYFRFLRSPSSK